jgi:RND family efflux transporter MFP subunit
MRIRTFAALVLLVVGIGAIVYATVGPTLGTASSSTRYLTSQAAVADVVDQVSATGTVAPVATYSFSFGSAPATSASASSSSSASSGSGGGSSSWIVDSVNVGVGQQVKAGDVLAAADTTSADLAVTVAQANVASAKSRLKTDTAGVTATDKAAAKLQVTQANQQLANTKSSYSQTVKQNNLKLSQARAALSRARKQLADDTVAKPPVQANVLAQDKNAITQAQDSLASLKLQISQSNSQATQQVNSAKLSVQSANYTYKQKLVGATAATIQSDEAAVAQAEQSLATAQNTVKYSQLVTPVDGIVSAVAITPGAAAPSGAAVTVRTTDLQVSGSVPEAELPAMRLGQDATVTLTALATDVTGKVTSIDQTGTSASNGGVVTYGIVVSLPKPPAGVAPGMSATIAITTQSAPGVLAVPAIALQRSNGQYAVRVLDAAGQPQSVPVDVGLVTSSMAEIKSGIQAGTAVVVGTSSSRQGTTSAGGGVGLPGLGGGGFGGGGFQRGGGGGGNP